MGFFENAVSQERLKCEKLLATQTTPYHAMHKIVYKEHQWGKTERQKVCTYSPILPEGEELKGFIFNIHGGGLISGSIAQNKDFCLWLADNGYTVFAIEYRLLPEVDFLSQVGDVCDAIDYLYEPVYDKPYYLIADSAGCHLALIVNALFSNHKGNDIRDSFGIHPIQHIDFDGVWLNSPMIQTTGFNKIGIFMAKYFYGEHWKLKGYSQYLKYPYDYLLRYLPQTVVITSSKEDDLYGQAKKAYKRLRGLGRYVKLFYSNMKNHSHDWNVLWPEKDEETIIINSAAFGFLTGQYEEEIAF